MGEEKTRSKLMSPEEYQARVNRLRQKEKELAQLEEKMRKQRELPHLHLTKHYTWSRRFFESRNKRAFLCAANQVGKSSIQIKKAIEWATNPTLWPDLWKTTPNQFWYFYPNFDTWTSEFYTKWEPLLPAGNMKKDANRGWEPIKERNHIRGVQFNSGVRIYGKAYSQKLEDVQAGTVYAMFLDEECPEPFMGELFLRLGATDGYMHAAFTATLGQDYWRRVIEPQTEEEELHADALKIQVSMYDCLQYEDGTPGAWSLERIKRIEQSCGTRAEIDKRVNGKFVVAGGRKFESFQVENNTVEALPIPPDWQVYTGVDPGSGGERGHPAAIIFVAVSPDYKMGRVFKAWRGDGVVTTAADILDKYVEMRGRMNPVVQSYDYSAKDFYTIACARGETFTPAIKRQDQGTDMMNSLFKNEMLAVQHGDPELAKLVTELTSLLKSSAKTMAKDDLCDALRYACMPIAWNWTEAIEDYLKRSGEGEKLKIKASPVETDKQRELRERREMFIETPLDPIEGELLAWGELYEP